MPSKFNGGNIVVKVRGDEDVFSNNETLRLLEVRHNETFGDYYWASSIDDKRHGVVWDDELQSLEDYNNEYFGVTPKE